MFTVDLIIPTRWQSIFRDSWSHFWTLPVDQGLWQHATLGRISPSSFPCSLAFRATIHPLSTSFRAIMSNFQFGVQSHFSSFGVQSHHRFSVSVFKAIVSFSFGVQSRSSHSLGIQSHLSSFGIQSHHRFSISAFRAIVSFSFGVQSRSSPSLGIQSHLSSFGVQSHYPFPAWRSEPPCLLVYDVQSRLSQHDIPSLAFRVITSSLGVQSHVLFHSTFRATIHSRFTTFGVTMPHFQFGVQSHHFSVSAFKAILITFSVLAFRAITIAFPVSAFKAITTSQFDVHGCIPDFGVQSHHYHFSVWRSEPSSFSVSAFRAIDYYSKSAI